MEIAITVLAALVTLGVMGVMAWLEKANRLLRWQLEKAEGRAAVAEAREMESRHYLSAAIDVIFQLRSVITTSAADLEAIRAMNTVLDRVNGELAQHVVEVVNLRYALALAQDEIKTLRTCLAGEETPVASVTLCNGVPAVDC